MAGAEEENFWQYVTQQKSSCILTGQTQSLRGYTEHVCSRYQDEGGTVATLRTGMACEDGIQLTWTQAPDVCT